MKKKKNIKAQLELEPNFPGVATPQRSEWVICIISYTNNPSSAPWGVPTKAELFMYGVGRALQYATYILVCINNLTISMYTL